MSKCKPAIVAVGYNRPECMKRLLDSIVSANYPTNDITLIVSIDEGEKSNEVEAVANSIIWKHGEFIVKRFEKPQGLKEHILQCGDLSDKYGAVIILEDDLVVSPCFYLYIMQCMDKYSDDKMVTGFALYSHAWNGYANVHFMPQKNEFDIYFGQFSITWGQCWTASQWKAFRSWYESKSVLSVNTSLPASIELWGEKSWGKFFANYIVEKNLYYVIPYCSLSTNYSEIGEHNFELDTAHQVMLLDCDEYRYNMPDFRSGIKYDIFFERVLDEDYIIHGIPFDEICMDISGQHRDNQGKEYLLTCRPNLKYEMVVSYGISLRPIEANVLKDIPGEGIYLYRLSKNVRLKPSRTFDNIRSRYELYNYDWMNIFKYLSSVLLGKTKRKIIGK